MRRQLQIGFSRTAILCMTFVIMRDCPVKCETPTDWTPVAPNHLCNQTWFHLAHPWMRQTLAHPIAFESCKHHLHSWQCFYADDWKIANTYGKMFVFTSCKKNVSREARIYDFPQINYCFTKMTGTSRFFTWSVKFLKRLGKKGLWMYQQSYTKLPHFLRSIIKRRFENTGKEAYAQSVITNN